MTISCACNITQRKVIETQSLVHSVVSGIVLSSNEGRPWLHDFATPRLHNGQGR